MRRLTMRQQHVLLVLANRGACACNDWAAWYPLEVSQVYGIMDRLGRRGLVDVAGFDGNARTFKITDDGLAVIDGLDEEDVEL